MPEPGGKSTWPKTEAGTIDWEMVFETPDTGLIPLIASAKTATALRESTLVVIRQLYSRKDDPPEVERFTRELTALIPDDMPETALPKLVDAVTAILRQIKDERIRKAAEFVQNKAMANDDGDKRDIVDRRVKKTKPKAGAKAKKKRAASLSLSDPKTWPVSPKIVGGVAAAVVAAIVGALVVFGPGGSEEDESDPNRVLINQMKTAAAGHPAKTHVYQGLLRVERKAGRIVVTAFGLPPSACASAAWYFVNRGSVAINQLMPRRVSPTILTELCDRNPAGATLAWISKEEDQAR